MQTRNLVDGNWIGADSGKEIPVRDPATDEEIARVPDCGVAETTRAVDAAAAAFPAWRARTAADRAAILRRWHDLMIRDRDELARIMTAEQGKPLAEARGEIHYAASFLDWAAGEAVRLGGETVPSSHPDKRILVLRQPVGVTAAITPWNFPSAMITRKAGPALAAGCTMVVKPAGLTPLSAIALGALAVEAGVPAGVLGIVTGRAGPVGSVFFDHPAVRKISFTGSTEVGKILMRQAADGVKRLSMELGGHAPFLVFEDADLDAAVAGAMVTKFRNTGQTCICANRFLVHASVREQFAARLAAAAKDLRVGRGSDEGVTQGPLIDDAAVLKVEEHVDDARSKGARVLAGGVRVKPADGLADRFYAPTVMDGVSRDMKIAHEETFGPVAPILEFRTEKEALEIANDSIFGLAAYFYTRDASRLVRVAEALEYGIIGANDGAPSTAQAPFGGVKQSGFGREGGHWVMSEYTDVKYVSWGIQGSVRE